ncbi:hypothetical protein [Burkholderia sp. AU28863]|uniref:hypothetical protein n=1 Tax=Burkholderia sp. AU28863 TaxID=2015352 RepID=UPI0011783183|nr:hypothetical protein [Burkholderia sp. AU28863]
MLNVAGNCKPQGSGYTATVLETTGTGFGDPIMMADDRRSAVFLRPYAFARLFNGWAWVGRPLGLPVPSCRFANPVQCPPTPFGDGTRAFLNHDGGRTMPRRILARPEQTQFPVELVRAALRAAATSDRPNEAIDILADALLRLAEIAEVHHG